MYPRWLSSVCLALTLAVVPQSGCSPGAPAVDSAAFEAAVNTYLRSQSMDMKAGRFRALNVSGTAATATVSLSQADGAVGVSVQWQFSFVQQNGTWVVSACRRR